MQRWKRLVATGLVASVALLGAACEVEDDDDGTTVIEDETPVEGGDETNVDVTEEETTVDSGDGTETEG